MDRADRAARPPRRLARVDARAGPPLPRATPTPIPTWPGWSASSGPATTSRSPSPTPSSGKLAELGLGDDMVHAYNALMGAVQGFVVHGAGAAIAEPDEPSAERREPISARSTPSSSRTSPPTSTRWPTARCRSGGATAAEHPLDDSFEFLLDAAARPVIAARMPRKRRVVTVSTAELLDAAHGLAADVVALRHELHRWPELGLHIPRTRDTVLGRAGGPAARRHAAPHHLRHRRAAHRRSARVPRCCCAATWTRCRCRRTPARSAPHRSTGRMHACGHDGHTAMLVGRCPAAAATRRDQLAGRVLFMFQPGEENGCAGADTCWTRACSTFRRTPSTAARRRSRPRMRCTSRPTRPPAWWCRRPGPLMASSDRTH